MTTRDEWDSIWEDAAVDGDEVEEASSSTSARLASQTTSLAPEFGRPHFRCLGVDGTTYYYQAAKVSQVIALAGPAHRIENLLRLAPLQWWEMEFPGRGGIDIKAAVNGMVSTCMHVGMYSADRVTGRGVYVEKDGTVIAHLGDRLIVNGERREIFEASTSRRIFEERDAIEIGDADPLTTDEAKRLDDLIQRVDFTEKDMARVFIGWLVIAPMCGALNWRAHLWLTGPFESGKSFLVKEVAGRVLGEFAVTVRGATTEAGIRQELQSDALPVLFDEAEAKDQNAERRLADILELVRASSSAGGAKILKGSAGGRNQMFRIRSSFLFAAIDASIKQSADESRIIRLTLRGPSLEATDDERRALKERRARFLYDLEALLVEHYGERLFLRTLSLLPIIKKNTTTLALAISEKTGSMRLGDLLGGPLAGWLSLRSELVLNDDEARAYIAESAWLGEALTRSKTARDHTLALSHLMQSTLRLDGGAERTIAELIDLVVTGQDAGGEKQDLLRRFGLRVDMPEEPGGGYGLFIGRGTNGVRKLFFGTQWASDPVGALSQHPGASMPPHPVRFAGSVKARAVRIDLEKAGQEDD